MKKISILLPTRNRILMVQKLFESIINKTSDLSSLEVVLYVDEDDSASQELVTSAFSLNKVTGRRDTMGAMLQSCYEKCTGRYVLLLNDDAIFRTPGWDFLMLQKAVRFDDDIALIYVNDRYHGKGMPTFPFLPRRTCEIMGKICPKEYKRHCIETHLFDIFKRLENFGQKRLCYLAEVVVEHMNYELTEFSYDQKPIDSYMEDQNLYLRLSHERQVTALALFSALNLSASQGRPWMWR